MDEHQKLLIKTALEQGILSVPESSLTTAFTQQTFNALAEEGSWIANRHEGFTITSDGTTTDGTTTLGPLSDSLQETIWAIKEMHRPLWAPSVAPSLPSFDKFTPLEVDLQQQRSSMEQSIVDFINSQKSYYHPVHKSIYYLSDDLRHKNRGRFVRLVWLYMHLPMTDADRIPKNTEPSSYTYNNICDYVPEITAEDLKMYDPINYWMYDAPSYKTLMLSPGYPERYLESVYQIHPDYPQKVIYRSDVCSVKILANIDVYPL